MQGIVTVEVTQQFIDAAYVALNGRLSRECNCPVSFALGEAGFRNPRVRQATFTAGDATDFTHHGERRMYKLPVEASLFIQHFDDNHHVDPFSFDVDADDYTRELYG